MTAGLDYKRPMSVHLTSFEGSVTEAIQKAIADAVAGAEVEVSGGGGHFRIAVTSKAFDGKPMLQRHRLVMRSIAHLMEGENAPVHAIDHLDTKVP